MSPQHLEAVLRYSARRWCRGVSEKELFEGRLFILCQAVEDLPRRSECEVNRKCDARVKRIIDVGSQVEEGWIFHGKNDTGQDLTKGTCVWLLWTGMTRDKAPLIQRAGADAPSVEADKIQ